MDASVQCTLLQDRQCLVDAGVQCELLPFITYTPTHGFDSSESELSNIGVETGHANLSAGSYNPAQESSDS